MAFFKCKSFLNGALHDPPYDRKELLPIRQGLSGAYIQFEGLKDLALLDACNAGQPIFFSPNVNISAQVQGSSGLILYFTDLSSRANLPHFQAVLVKIFVTKLWKGYDH